MKKMLKKEKAKWVEKLKPFAQDFEGITDEYQGKIAKIEKQMNNKFNSKVWEYEIFISDCGWLIGRRNKKMGRKQALVHDMEFYKEPNEKRK